MATLETVKIADDSAQGGWRIINERDFDEDEHMRYDEADATTTAEGLPDDYPGKSALEEAGYDSAGEVEDASDEDLLAVDGIGDTTVKKIRSYEGE